MRSGLRTFAARLALALLLAGQTLAAGAADTAVSEYAVKSALLLKLSRFVYFPEQEQEQEQEQPRQLCVLGQNPFGNILQQLNQASGTANKLRLKFLYSAQQSGGCHFVFISQSERRKLGLILRQLEEQALVTISDIRGFTRSGGMLELSLAGEQNTQLNIFINRQAARQQGISFNAQLLRLAILVNEETEPEP